MSAQRPSPEAPLVHLVANLQHLKGKSLADLVRIARYRRRKSAPPQPASDEPAHTLKEFLSEHPSTTIREFNEARVKGVAT